MIKLSGKNRFSAKSLLKKKVLLLGASALFTLGVIVSVVLTPPVWKLKEGPIHVTRWPKSGETVFKIGPTESHWVPINTVSRHVLNAIVVSEDARFYEHIGLDFIEIQKSIIKNLREGRYARGASTITQQVVKMAFLSSEKNLLRKFREAIGAVALEMILTKNEILEWYINLAEFGDGVFGIKAAAWHYFATKPELLTIQHGANLALVLPSPNSWSKGLRQKKLTPFGHRRYAQIISRMRQAGFITETLWLNALATGDFGRPVKAYHRILAARKAKAETERLEALQPESMADEEELLNESDYDLEASETDAQDSPEGDPSESEDTTLTNPEPLTAINKENLTPVNEAPASSAKVSDTVIEDGSHNTESIRPNVSTDEVKHD